MKWHMQSLCHRSFVNYVTQNCLWTIYALSLFKTKLIKGNCHLKKQLHVFEVRFHCKRACLNGLVKPLWVRWSSAVHAQVLKVIGEKCFKTSCKYWTGISCIFHNCTAFHSSLCRNNKALSDPAWKYLNSSREKQLNLKQAEENRTSGKKRNVKPNDT